MMNTIDTLRLAEQYATSNRKGKQFKACYQEARSKNNVQDSIEIALTQLNLFIPFVTYMSGMNS